MNTASPRGVEGLTSQPLPLSLRNAENPADTNSIDSSLLYVLPHASEYQGLIAQPLNPWEASCEVCDQVADPCTCPAPPEPQMGMLEDQDENPEEDTTNPRSRCRHRGDLEVFLSDVLAHPSCVPAHWRPEEIVR